MTIVPRTKLIVLAGIVFLPVSILAAVMPTTVGPGVLLAVALVVVAAADAAVSRLIIHQQRLKTLLVHS